MRGGRYFDEAMKLADDMPYWLEQAEAELATPTQERKDGR
jgi:hypothetical protein